MDVAIVGCGMIADAHVQEIRKISGATIVGVCDREPLLAEQLAERKSIPKYYSNFGEMLQELHPTVVHILTPPDSHMPLGLEALDSGCHVLLEKPFTVNADEAQILIEKAQAASRKVMVNHFHNFSPPSLKLREMISQKILGDILHIEGYYSYSLKSPVAKMLLGDPTSWIHRLPGGVIHNNIDHLLGKIVGFLPDENLKVFALGKRVSGEAKNVSHSYFHDELRAMVDGGNISAYLTFSSNISPAQHFMAIYGTDNSVFIDYESRTILLCPNSKLPGPFGKLSYPFDLSKQSFLFGLKNIFKFASSEFHYYSGMNKLLQDYYDSIEFGFPVPIPYVEILRNTKIIDEIVSQISTQTEPECY